MSKTIVGEAIVSGMMLVVLGIFLTNPNGMWLMPESIHMMFLVILAVLYFVFTLLVWNEGVKDEREELHRLAAGRTAFVSGVSVLVLAIVWQSFHHEIDPWLLVALGVMLVAKVGSRVYVRARR